MDLLLYFWLLLKASLFSTGGLGNLPILHEDLLARGWATDRQFAEALAVGQISPGPSGLWVISLGYLTAGWVGSALAVIAICLPPLVVLVVERVYRRLRSHVAVEGFVRGLSISVLGVFLVVLVGFLRSNGLDWRALAITVGAIGLALTRRVPVLAILLLAAAVGVLLYQ
ncbi:MAG: chromate transporter [Chloroflexota bacterium]|nr:chromate transporter [Chloroflexota bacterium]